MLAKTFCSSHHGVDGICIEVEASLQNALPQIHLTGLPGSVVRESRDRLEACFTGLGLDLPSGRVVVHLSPANAPKQGSQFDLAIALAVLGAEGRLPREKLEKTGAIGELALDGRLRGVPGALALIEALEKNSAIHDILIPEENQAAASLLKARKVRIARDIGQCIDFVRGVHTLLEPGTFLTPEEKSEFTLTLDSVVGQGIAKRTLQIALAGQHHLLFLGPPGVGKSLLAYTAADLLPELFDEEKIALHKIYGLIPRGEGFRGKRPFRSPHHSISRAGLLGGGTGMVYPGEISMAHAGILFLDEFLEFQRDSIEGLREPLQSGKVHLHRAQSYYTFPARFTLVAAMNPCPCGYSMSPVQRCRCRPEKLLHYRKRLSGPILDRMDLGVVLGPPMPEESFPLDLSHGRIKESIQQVREKQRARSPELLRIDHPSFTLDPLSEEWLKERSKAVGLSFRSLHKIIRVARTIADLENRERIEKTDLFEAWNLKCLESLNPFSN